MISIIFFSQTLLQGGEMTVMDSEVIETQQVFEEIVLKAVSKGNLQGNKVVGILKPEIPDNVQNPRYFTLWVTKAYYVVFREVFQPSRVIGDDFR